MAMNKIERIPGMEASPDYPAEPADHDTEEMEDTENE